MSISQMKDEIIKLYPGDKWYNKVNKMKDSQIIAIYNKLIINKKN